jgi:hypothetical protein
MSQPRLLSIKELLGKCVVLEDFRLHLCCCGWDVGMTAGGPTAGADVDASSSRSKSLHCLMLGFCQKVDAGVNSMARKVLELCPWVTELTVKFGWKLDPVALLTNHLQQEGCLQRCNSETPHDMPFENKQGQAEERKD